MVFVNKMTWPQVIFHAYFISYLFNIFADGKNGLLLLYRPIDISNECAFSGHLRYDLSFGMGMSDTITMVLRTLNGLDYKCNIEIASIDETYLIIVIKFPTSLYKNCMANEDTFMVMKKNKCLRLCDLLGSRDLNSSYFVMIVKGRLRFRFLSNNSINTDINAEMYQVTATSARYKPATEQCHVRNETLCVTNGIEFCFTSGVVCDGIKNCGVKDWFDERLSECSLPVEYLGYASVITIVGAVACAVLALVHILMRCLPPLAGSFFIFNANEDNRLCIDPLLKPKEHTLRAFEKTKSNSLIPVTSSSSSNDVSFNVLRSETYPSGSYANVAFKDVSGHKRNTTVKSMASKFHEKLRSMARRGKLSSPSNLEMPMNTI